MTRPMRAPGVRGGPGRPLARGGALLAGAIVIGALGGWTKRVRAADDAAPDVTFVREVGGAGDVRGQIEVIRAELDRANAILDYSTRYQIPADLSTAIYDIALNEGIDPAIAFRLVKVESNFDRNARSSMGALGYTQLQLATARFYDPAVTERTILDRDTNLKIGFRFLRDLLDKFDRDAHLALLAYNRGPARVERILAAGGDPTNGYSDAVLKVYRAPSGASE